MIDLRFDAKDLKRILGPLSGMPKLVDDGLRSAIRRTAATMRTDVNRQIRLHSFLKAGDITPAISKPLFASSAGSFEGVVRISGKPLAMDKFRLVPRRVTARKRMRSSRWGLAGYQIGPGEPVRQATERGGRSKGFVVRLGGKLYLMRRSGKKMQRMYGYSAQYFAVFDAVRRTVENNARQNFEKRMAHELSYRLGKLR